MKIDQIEEAQKKKAKALLTLGSVNAIGQFALIFYGTFHYLSWDIMEPVCYLMTFGNFTAGYFFYVYMKKDLDLVAQDRHIITFVAIIIAIAHWGTIEANIAVRDAP